MGDFLSDLRYSFRMLIGSPAFTVTAIAALALGPFSGTDGISPNASETIRIAVGTHIAMRPPHKTGRAAFPHPAPTSGV
jgi:hypothetical protein